MNIEEQKSFYDKYWSTNKFINSLQLRRCVKILEYFTVVKRKIRKPLILDLGSGDGRLTAFLGQFGMTDAVELSQQAVDNANELYPHVNFQQGDALAFNFKDKTYHVIVSQEVLEHIEDKSKYINVCYNVLKPQGYLILTTPNKNVLDHMTDGKTWSDQPIELPISKQELKKILRQQNFKILKYESIVMNFGNKGYYKLINHRYAVAIFKKIGLAKFRESVLSKLGYGLHHCILAQKQ
ncbi:bifunctional 2-polyprenyl-6-hydroxyphenol methylase/3-demethylubiquinol 3-O-methyltransferase UbiG [Winogradskyella sp.]|jgi:SAM-dependent methyltransferase|uniref:class I SAM-dependent methyltransferase n=1 Tax=Winogradskyella sp. TaxID=1883156 RepID=UPI0025D91355|nr:class I SAM-dependent methyltransferase [Winogradskyella sp.]MCT4628391.1 class I SAM-dependent methyltransferase [Winogradskyella sp.]